MTIETARMRKRELVSEAERLAGSTDWKSTVSRQRSLMEQWKQAGSAGAEDQALWAQFNAARQRFFDALGASQDEARSRKTDLVMRAQFHSDSSEWKATHERMQGLQREWAVTGFAGKSDDDRLWRDFRAAQDRFYKRWDEDRHDNGVKKRDLVSQARNLANPADGDFRRAKDEFRQLMERWKAIGPAPRDKEDHLWRDFQSARDELYFRAQDAHKHRTVEMISKTEQNIAKQEAIIYRTEELISRERDWRSSIGPGGRQYELIAKADAKISELEQTVLKHRGWLDEAVARLGELRSRL